MKIRKLFGVVLLSLTLVGCSSVGTTQIDLAEQWIIDNTIVENTDTQLSTTFDGMGEGELIVYETDCTLEDDLEGHITVDIQEEYDEFGLLHYVIESDGELMEQGYLNVNLTSCNLYSGDRADWEDYNNIPELKEKQQEKVEFWLDVLEFFLDGLSNTGEGV